MRGLRFLMIVGLVACDDSSTEDFEGGGDQPFLRTVASCPVYENGKLVGTDVIFYYRDPGGAVPEVGDFGEFLHELEPGAVLSPGVRFEGETAMTLYPQATQLKRYSMFENAGTGTLVYVKDLSEPGPLTRADVILMAFGVPQPIHVGGVVFSEAVVRVQPVTTELEDILRLLTPPSPGAYVPFSSPRTLGYREALSAAMAMFAERGRPRVIILDTGHRTFPDPEQPPLNTPAGPLLNADMSAIASELAETDTTLIVLHQLIGDMPQMNLIEPDLQQLACQSGGFLVPAVGHEDLRLWSPYTFELALSFYWRLRATWPPVDAQPGVVKGFVTNKRAGGDRVHFSAAWRRME